MLLEIRTYNIASHSMNVKDSFIEHRRLCLQAQFCTKGMQRRHAVSRGRQARCFFNRLHMWLQMISKGQHITKLQFWLVSQWHYHYYDEKRWLSNFIDVVTTHKMLIRHVDIMSFDCEEASFVNILMKWHCEGCMPPPPLKSPPEPHPQWTYLSIMFGARFCVDVNA